MSAVNFDSAISVKRPGVGKGPQTPKQGKTHSDTGQKPRQSPMPITAWSEAKGQFPLATRFAGTDGGAEYDCIFCDRVAGHLSQEAKGQGLSWGAHK